MLFDRLRQKLAQLKSPVWVHVGGRPQGVLFNDPDKAARHALLSAVYTGCDVVKIPKPTPYGTPTVSVYKSRERQIEESKLDS